MILSDWFDWKETEDLGRNLRFHQCVVKKAFGPFAINDKSYFIDLSLEDGDILCYSGNSSKNYHGKLKVEII